MGAITKHVTRVQGLLHILLQYSPLIFFMYNYGTTTRLLYQSQASGLTSTYCLVLAAKPTKLR